MARSACPVTCIVLALLLSGCERQRGKPPVLATVYAGPISLSLRQELAPDAPMVAAIPHGEKLDVVQTRRRFIKVRTKAGVEGWTDTRQLLTEQQMAALRELARRAGQIPPQGQAHTYEPLNVHTEPYRQAPSFYQIREDEPVDMLWPRVMPRENYKSTPLLPKTAPRKKPAKKPHKEAQQPVLSPPPTPTVPRNWLELSKSPTFQPTPEELEEMRRAEEAREQEAAKPVRLDDWLLVRLKDGRAGWALSRSLQASIPEEVAQYSEGARITSYWPLNQVNDDGVVKTNWLWTTSSNTGTPVHYDGFRVFSWRLSKDRYETTYIARKQEGYFPVVVQPVEVEINRRMTKVPGFTVLLREEDGRFVRNTYAYEGWRVRLLQSDPGKPPVDPLAGVPISPPPGSAAGEGADDAEEETWLERLKARFRQAS